MTTLARRADVAAYALAALCVVAITLLGALGQAIPDVLGLVATGAIGVGAGAAIPGARRAGTPPADPTPPAPVGVRGRLRETTPQTPILAGGDPV